MDGGGGGRGNAWCYGRPTTHVLAAFAALWIGSIGKDKQKSRVFAGYPSLFSCPEALAPDGLWLPLNMFGRLICLPVSSWSSSRLAPRGVPESCLLTGQTPERSAPPPQAEAPMKAEPQNSRAQAQSSIGPRWEGKRDMDSCGR